MNSLEQDIRALRSKSKLPTHVSDRLLAKYHGIANRCGINFDATILGMTGSPNLYDQLDDIPSLSLFFRRHIDIWLELKGTDSIVYSKEEGAWLRVARESYRIALARTEIESAESWSRLTSISKTRSDHWSTSGKPKKSKFLGKFKYILPLETSAFNRGIGVLIRPNVMRMYGKFKTPIGRSPRGEDQEFICVECERVHRRQDTNAKNPEKVFGYKVRIHGYPMTEKDIEKDFRGTPLRYSDVPVVGFST
jgi:hypothetical protein